ncbi:hypothetical protein DK389_31220 [Methylobacterium durans]|uniref:Uncharacterized protein n=1 Tax=Methylobacterium durans TaxID=2202825 RepID=A0A2U8WFQ4_9HYPH|nr:hypothetical protein DK389_31220 [Methylobacterium durans]
MLTHARGGGTWAFRPDAYRDQAARPAPQATPAPAAGARRGSTEDRADLEVAAGLRRRGPIIGGRPPNGPALRARTERPGRAA